MSELLELQSVRAGYDESDVLQGVSLSVPRGSIVGLAGRNGVGKTTTLRSVTGQLEPTDGSILFDGTEITHGTPSDAYKRGIRLIPEDRGIFTSLTVAENLSVPIVEDPDRERSIGELYEVFPRLEERKDSKAGNLSGGEQQMLAIARALRSDPKLLLLDEPSEGLAPQIVEKVASLIARVADEGATILLVEQNIEFTLDLVSYVYVMDGGQIVYDGSVEELRDQRDVLDRHLGVTTTS